MVGGAETAGSAPPTLASKTTLLSDPEIASAFSSVNEQFRRCCVLGWLVPSSHVVV